MSSQMISCLSWIPKGCALENPLLYEVGDEVVDELTTKLNNNMSIQNAEAEDDDEIGSDLEESDVRKGDILEQLNMDEYDDDDEDEEKALDNFIQHRNLSNYVPDAAVDVEDDEDIEENKVRSTDSLILVGNTTEEESVMEIYLFDESTNNLYVHHDFILPAFPLTTTWLSCDPSDGSLGSFAAVGTFLPGIEIWNCDVMNPLEPTCILGGLVDTPEPVTAKKSKLKSKGKAKKNTPQFKEGSHTDAVMALAWHKAVPARLASGSADTTIKLWDVTTQKCVETYRQHKDKVQALEWNPTEHFILLSGSYDRTARVMDIRAPDNAVGFKVTADIETVKWNPTQPYLFYASTEDGKVTSYDIRNPSAALWSLQAHTKATTCLTPNVAVPTMFATASIDGLVKIWDTTNNQPTLVTQRDLDVGKLFCMSFDQSSPFVIAAGGDTGALAIWDTMENIHVNERYAAKAQELGLGEQKLTEQHIELQKQGLQAKGLGPGREGAARQNSDERAGDSESDDDDMRMDAYKPMGDDDEEEEIDEDEMDE